MYRCSCYLKHAVREVDRRQVNQLDEPSQAVVGQLLAVPHLLRHGLKDHLHLVVGMDRGTGGQGPSQLDLIY